MELFHSYMYLEARKLMNMNAFFLLIKQDYMKTHGLKTNFFENQI